MLVKKILEIRCLNCTNTFFKIGKNKFCCRNCQNTYNARKRRQSRADKSKRFKECQYCRCELLPNRRKFCSKKCNGLYSHKHSGWKHQTKYRTKTPKDYIRHLLNHKRKYALLVNYEDVYKVYESQNGLCAISKEPMTWILGKGKLRTNISLDRIDSSLPYTKENIQLVCTVVNLIKSDMSLEEFRDWCFKVVKGKYK